LWYGKESKGKGREGEGRECGERVSNLTLGVKVNIHVIVYSTYNTETGRD